MVLINAVKDVAKALGNLISATKAAAGKPHDDPSMLQLKNSAKVRYKPILFEQSRLAWPYWHFLKELWVSLAMGRLVLNLDKLLYLQKDTLGSSTFLHDWQQVLGYVASRRIHTSIGYKSIGYKHPAVLLHSTFACMPFSGVVDGTEDWETVEEGPAAKGHIPVPQRTWGLLIKQQCASCC